jgi:hypothetical protein
MMNYQELLTKLDQMRELFYRATWEMGLSDSERRQLRYELVVQFGEIEDSYTRITGNQNVELKSSSTSGAKANFKSYLEAAILCPWGRVYDLGYNELLKVIGKIRQYQRDPAPLAIQHSLTYLSQVLRRFRECCNYWKLPLDDEKAIQDIIWIMLRSHFERLDREETLPKLGIKNYRPDFGIPDLGAAVEVKYIGQGTSIPRIQEEILADIPGYINENTLYSAIVVFIYDSVHKLRDPQRFISDLRNIDGIFDVIVVPGI